MDNRIYITAAVVFVLALLGIIAYNTLEIYHETEHMRKMYPDRYYILEQWLNQTGNPVKKENWKNLKDIESIQEKIIVFYSSVCKWEEAGESLLSWAGKGNSLVICIDSYNFNETDYIYLWSFLSENGIYIEEKAYSEDYRNNDIPDFDWDISFKIDDDEKAGISIMKDNKDNIRLVEFPAANGRITVIGYPVFMLNYNIEKEVNARLAWELTGNRAEKNGVLFIRSGYIEKSLFGKIIKRGNLLPLGVSVFIVIITGFWMVIPVFGLVFDEKLKISRPIQERFSAEANFLKKNKALGYYIDVYNRELQTQESDLTYMKNYNYRDIINKLRRMNYDTNKLKRRSGGFKT